MSQAVWWPKCGAMLPPGLEKCPRCGKKLGNSQELGCREILWLSGYVLAIALLPLLVVAGLGLICSLLGGN